MNTTPSGAVKWAKRSAISPRSKRSTPAGSETTCLGQVAESLQRAPRRGQAQNFPVRRRGLAEVWAVSSLSPSALLSRGLFLALVAVVALITVITTVWALRWLDRPFAGFLVNERMVVGNIGRYDWTGVQAGLAWPDRIVAAGDRPITAMRGLRSVVEAAGAGEPIRYSVERAGQIVQLTIPTMRFTWADLVMTHGIPLLTGLVYASTAVVVFILKPDTAVSWAFAIAAMSMALFAITSFDVQSTHGGLVRLYLLVNALFPAAFVHLSLLFPTPTAAAARRPLLKILPYVAAGALVLPLEVFYPRPSFLAVYQVVRAYAIGAAIAMTVAALRAYVSGASSLARQRAKVVLVGASAAFPLPALAFYMSLYGSSWLGFSVQNNFLGLPVTFFPVAVGYAIARHNLFDVDTYLKRAVGYGIMTMLVATAYVVLQALVRTLVLRPLLANAADVVSATLFAVLVVFFFNPISRRVQETVDRIFFRGKLDYMKTVSTVSDALTSMLNRDHIFQRVVTTIRHEMFVDAAGVIARGRESDRAEAFLVGDADARGSPVGRRLTVAADDPLLTLLREEQALVTRYDLEEVPSLEPVRQVGLKRFAELEAVLAIPLLCQGQVTGALVVGERKSGQFYSREDVELLTTMANQAAVAIQNAVAHEEVVRYAEELATSLRRIEILESIKTNLAKFVPHTVSKLIEESPHAPLFDKREMDVSVVFADMSGYTRLSAQLELDQVDRLVERYFGAFLDEIIEHGGDVNETAGDGLMVIFRDPDASQHARAGVRAALAIQRRTEEINLALQNTMEPVAMHIGVNSGIASVGATKIEGMAGTRWTYTASGPTTNIAARVAALAGAGIVLVTEDTRRRLDDSFKVEGLGPQTLKNVPHPIGVYQVIEELASAATAADVSGHPPDHPAGSPG
jgi:class 3 adenylate cyclase